ncbi:hypothetical protein [Brachyspira catarrhinii]|uniref:Uncharacterized protein n=1 Tax=Brachyspira catarrhinii TaxID=2528966 RepID=A0ABY2TQF7_9SPIR|nr:hypothetical protein [Brachyspira catarrhinii]TKZ30182.1 hypothetical protein EZH24_10565 [Brachyspira catarrhinii]
MKKLLVLFILLTNSILFSFEVPDNVQIINEEFKTHYILVTEDYYFNLVDINNNNLSLYLSIKTPKLSYTNRHNYERVFLMKLDKSITSISDLSYEDKRIEIIEGYGNPYLYDIYNNCNSDGYRLTYFEKFEKTSDILGMREVLIEFINDYGNDIDIIFTIGVTRDYDEYKSENILRANYKSFYKDFLTILNLYRDIVIDRL